MSVDAKWITVSFCSVKRRTSSGTSGLTDSPVFIPLKVSLNGPGKNSTLGAWGLALDVGGILGVGGVWRVLALLGRGKWLVRAVWMAKDPTLESLLAAARAAAAMVIFSRGANSRDCRHRYLPTHG